MRKIIVATIASFWLCFAVGCDARDKLVSSQKQFSGIWGVSAPVSSFPAFGAIPDKYASPSNISPPLDWKVFVKPVKDYVLFVEDVDAKDAPTVNWIVYGVPEADTQLAEGASTSTHFLQGKTRRARSAIRA